MKNPYYAADECGSLSSDATFFMCYKWHVDSPHDVTSQSYLWAHKLAYLQHKET